MGRPRLPEHPDPAVQRKRVQQRRRNDIKRARRAPVRKAIIDEFLSRPCVDCGVQYPLPAMHPDHVRGEKSYKIAWFRGGNGSLEKLHEELAKCDVRCANCHCIRHAK